MDAVTAKGRAATRLLADKESMAGEVTRLLYEESPELMERYGPAGRDRCFEDVRYTIDHLIPAVDLGRPTLFASYVEWLEQLLRANNVPTREVARSLELVAEVARTRLAADEADVVATTVRAGLASLPAESNRRFRDMAPRE